MTQTTQRIALAAAAGLAAFIVVLLGALGTYVLLGGAQSAAVANRSPSVAKAADSPAQVQAPLFQDAPGQSAPPQGSQPGDSNSSNGYAVSADDAAGIALSSVPGSSLLQEPRLVNFGGTVAYEVPLNLGNVYVDAASGEVLYNAANGTVSPRRRRPRN